MDQTLHALGNILLQALPTFFLVVLLTFYLKWMFFGPLGKVLEKRREATEGARRRAEEMYQKAEQKAAGYEAALQAARSDLYREQEAERRKAREAHNARIREAREQTATRLEKAKSEIAQEVTAAKASLASQVEPLAEQIMRRVLGRGAAA